MNYKVLFSLLIATFCVSLHGMKRKVVDVEQEERITKNFIELCKSRSIEPIRELLDAGANVHSEVLHIAAQHGDIFMIGELLRRGAHVNAVNGPDKWTPLHYAAAYGQEDACEFLIAHEANKEARTKRGSTPLHIAAMNGKYDVCEFLISKRVNKEPKEDRERTPLHIAASNGHLDICKLLINKKRNKVSKVNKDAQDKKGRTPLYSAALNGHPDVCEFLIDERADQSLKTYDQGCTVLHVAAEKGLTAICKNLICTRSDKNSTTKTGWTPLHFAAYNEKIDTCKCLLRFDAKINLRTTERKLTPLDVAAESGHVETFIFLRIEGGSLRDNYLISLMHKDKIGHDKVYKMLTGLYHNNCKEKTFHGALHIAAFINHKEACKFLINKDVSIEAPTEDGYTPLHNAAESGSAETCELLLSKEANIHAKNNKRETPIDLAKKNNHTSIVDLLKKQEDKIKILSIERSQEKKPQFLIDALNRKNTDRAKELFSKRVWNRDEMNQFTIEASTLKNQAFLGFLFKRGASPVIKLGEKRLSSEKEKPDSLDEEQVKHNNLSLLIDALNQKNIYRAKELFSKHQWNQDEMNLFTQAASILNNRVFLSFLIEHGASLVITLGEKRLSSEKEKPDSLYEEQIKRVIMSSLLYALSQGNTDQAIELLSKQQWNQNEKKQFIEAALKLTNNNANNGGFISLVYNLE